jgi:hypothetical protein
VRRGWAGLRRVSEECDNDGGCFFWFGRFVTGRTIEPVILRYYLLSECCRCLGMLFIKICNKSNATMELQNFYASEKCNS